MKRFVLLLLALCLLTCTCVSYSGYIFSRQGILSTNQTAPNTGGYPPGQGPPNTGGYPPGQGPPPGDGSGYPPGVLQPDGSGNSPVVPPPGRVLGRTGVQPPPITAGYPPGQGSPNTGGYPPGSQLPNTGGYPPGSQLPNTGGYPPGSQLPNTGGYPHSNLPITHGCQNNKYNEEPGVFVGTDPAPGGAAASGGKIRVWINDEGAPKLAPNEKVDPVTGQITPGDRTALDGRGKGYYRWEPALYITPLTSANQNGPFSNDAENGGKPYFPSLIKGDYNPDVTVQDKRKGSGLQGPPVDADYTRFENGIGGGGGGGGRGKGIGGLPERFTAEDIWDVNSLGLAPGPYHVELVIHDGDHDLGIDCVALNIGGTAQVVPPPGTSGYPQGVPPGTSGYHPSNLPTTHGCQNNANNDEPEIFVGTDPAPGGAAASGGKIRVWVNDEGAPKIAPNEKVDPVTGQITPGDRTALDGRGKGYYRWEPALYITPLTSANQSGPFGNDAENGGKPYFPSLIKGDYNPNVKGDKGSGLKGPPIDGDYTQFENGPTSSGGKGKGGGEGKGGGGLSEKYTAEYIWDVNALGLPPGAYHVQMVIHDGDDNLGIDCVALNISGNAQVVPPVTAVKAQVVPPVTAVKAQVVPPVTGGYPIKNLPTVHGCQNNANNDEPEIFVGTDPPPGGAAAPGGKIRVWINDEGAPKIAPNEKVDPVTGQITPGDRTALDGRGTGYYRWEPALYITPLKSANQSGPFSNDAEKGGKPYFPTLIKGDYNPDTKSDKGSGLKGPPIDDYTQFENGPSGGGGGKGKGGGGLSEKYTAEYIWDVNALGLPPGAYHVQMVIHDGDDNLGIDCVALNI